MQNAKNNANATENATENAKTIKEMRAELSKKLKEYTQILANEKLANYHFEIYSQTGTKTLVLLQSAQNALSKMFDFKPLPRISNKNFEIFETYCKACEFCNGCIRGVDKIK